MGVAKFKQHNYGLWEGGINHTELMLPRSGGLARHRGTPAKNVKNYPILKFEQGCAEILAGVDSGQRKLSAKYGHYVENAKTFIFKFGMVIQETNMFNIYITGLGIKFTGNKRTKENHPTMHLLSVRSSL